MRLRMMLASIMLLYIHALLMLVTAVLTYTRLVTNLCLSACTWSQLKSYSLIIAVICIEEQRRCSCTAAAECKLENMQQS